MTDSGKHSALRQTDDGSFEIVFERDGLQEISEDEVSVAEIESPEPREPQPRASNRILLFTAGGVVLLLLLATAGWFALGSRDAATASTDEVPGFRPYVGGEETENASSIQARKARIAAAAAAAEEEPNEEDPAESEPAVEEITESEPGWELTEAEESGVVVEVEGEDSAAAEQGDVVEEGAQPDAPVRALNARRGFESVRNADIGRNLRAPRVPIVNGNPLAAERLQKLPIRTIPPAEVAGEDEMVDEDILEEDGEAIEEEVEDLELDENDEVIEDE